MFTEAEKYVTSFRTSSKVVNVSFDADSDVILLFVKAIYITYPVPRSYWVNGVSLYIVTAVNVYKISPNS